jgi:archaellum component FlaC
MWISDAQKATLSEIEAQINELKRLLEQLESDIQDQLRRGTR